MGIDSDFDGERALEAGLVGWGYAGSIGKIRLLDGNGELGKLMVLECENMGASNHECFEFATVSIGLVKIAIRNGRRRGEEATAKKRALL